MTQLHATGGVLLLVLSGLFALAAVALAIGPGTKPWLELGRRALNALIGIQVLLGAILFVTGRRPGETIHWLYGALVAGVIPLASVFSAEAPARPRAAVLAAGGLVTAALVLRSIGTGG